MNISTVAYKALTNTEQKILDFVSRGWSSKEIATKLSISKHTVDTHRRNILKKRLPDFEKEMLQPREYI